ncbi:MAG: hypothetical protein ACKVVT_07805 [Dehalococcoidia bacterium]
MFPGARAIDPKFDPAELGPARDRLAAAVRELEETPGTPQHRLAAAWTRVAELRLPKVVAPTAVLDELERLIAVWDKAGRFGGITGAAYRLRDDAIREEEARIRWMRDITEEAFVRGEAARAEQR